MSPLPLPNIFDVYSSISLFLLASSCFRNSSSFSKDFMISVLLLTKSFSCLLNFSSSRNRTFGCHWRVPKNYETNLDLK